MVAPMDRLRTCASAAKTWLFDRAAGCWLETGWRPSGMFAERLDAEGVAEECPHRLFVQARQIYAFCELGRLGWTGEWRSRVEMALAHLLEKGRRADGFFVFSFSPDGEPLDARADLYAHAFVLFCLGHAADALKRADLLDQADELATLGEMKWRHPLGGFYEGEIAGPPRRQNPHMHMLEAATILWQISGGQRWKRLVDELTGLCFARFIDADTGALTEYFNSDWSKLGDGSGHRVEPGHCFEWAWLIESLHRCADVAIEPANRLVSFARSHGLCPRRGIAMNEVDLEGNVVDGRGRLWPQTERLKAALVRWRRTGATEEAEEAANAYAGLAKYLDDPRANLWRDKLLSDGTWLNEPSPASSFYHIVCGMSELIRTAGPS